MVQHLAYKLRGVVTNVYSYALACNVVGACATENLHKPMVENIISLLPFVLLETLYYTVPVHGHSMNRISL